MIIGILKESQNHEFRVAATAETVKNLIKLEHSVLVQKSSGNGAFISDEEFKDAGATIVESSNEIYSKSDIIFSVNSLDASKLKEIKNNSTIISFFQIKDESENIPQYINNSLSLISMSHVPRTTLAQNMDALSSQSNIAGYKAAIIGADHISKYMPLLMTAAGTIKPAKVLILGAGVAGLAAIANAKRMGAQVYAFDVRPIVKEQVESLGAKFVEVASDSDDGVGEGGYAKETSDEYKQKQAELLKEHIGNSDLVITTALIPGRPAPKIITKEMVDGMKGGSAIMDLASENGGNCEYTEPGKVIDHNGITIDGSFNIPGTMPIHASQVYAKNISALVTYLCPEAELKLDMDDEIVSGALFTYNGEITDERTKEALGGVA